MRPAGVKRWRLISHRFSRHGTTGVCRAVAGCVVAPGARVTVTHDGSDVPRLADEAARSGCDIVVAAGGDGTIARVAAALIPKEKALGVIPLGTFNFFAKKMGVPLDLASAVRTVLTGQATAINVGEVNGCVFLNNSSIGRYPQLMHQRNDAYRRFGRSRTVAFLTVGVALLRRGRMMTVRLQADDGADSKWRVPQKRLSS